LLTPGILTFGVFRDSRIVPGGVFDLIRRDIVRLGHALTSFLHDSLPQRYFIEQIKPDLIVLDLAMPGLLG
jgi:CheY-like chemotaxis protein